MSCFLCLIARLLLLESVNAYGKFVDTSKWIGAEYTPSNASNSLWWYNYETYTEQINKELIFMEDKLKFNSLRMFLHTLNYEYLGSKLINYMNDFLSKCEEHGIKAGFVFFGDCSFNKTVQIMDQPCPGTPGCSNGCWIASPQSNQRNINNITQFKPYVVDIINAFINDSRVLFWEIYNEPGNANVGGINYSYALRNAAYEWMTSLNPSQPIISCWNDNQDTQIIDIHQYDTNFPAWMNDIQSNPDKSAVITEGGSRWMPGANDAGSPVEVINFLTEYQLNNPTSNKGIIPGIFICWEVMVGNTMTRWHWGINPGAPEPVIPFDAHLFPDGTPISYTEVGMIRQYINRFVLENNEESEFVLLETFLETSDALTKDSYLTLADGKLWTQELNSSSKYFKEQYEFFIETTFWPTNMSHFVLEMPLSVITADGINETVVVYAIEVYDMKLSLILVQNGSDMVNKTLNIFDISTLIPLNGCGITTKGWNMLRVGIAWTAKTDSNQELKVSTTINVWLNQMVQNASQTRINRNQVLYIEFDNIDKFVDVVMNSISLTDRSSQTLIDYVSVLPDNLF